MNREFTKNEIANKFLNAVLEFPMDAFLELDKYYPIVAKQRRIGARTLGELAGNVLQKEEASEVMPHCPRCTSDQVVRFGSNSAGNPRYKCKECGKTFSASTNTLVSNVKQDAGVWMIFIQCLLEGKTLQKTAACCGISLPTALSWRLRVFIALEELAKEVKLSGLIYTDDKRIPYNLKGNHGEDFPMPRRTHKRGSQNNIHNHQKNEICVLCAVDGYGNAFSRCVGFGSPNGKRLINGFADKLDIDEQAVLVSDGARAYGMVVKHYGIPEWAKRTTVKKGKKRYPAVIDDISIQAVNSYHSRLEHFLAPSRGVASRYLPGYLLLFDYKENHKYVPMEEQIADIMHAIVRTTGDMTEEEMQIKFAIPVSNGPEKELWELKISSSEREVYRDWVNGIPPKAVAAKHNINKRQIYAIRDKVKRYGVHDKIMNPPKKATPRHAQPPTPRDWEIFRRHYRDGETLKTLATDYGVCFQAIHKVVQKVLRTPEGVALEKEWRKPKRRRKKDSPKDKVIRDVSLMTGPMTSINTACAIAADTYGCNVNTAKDWYYEHRKETGQLSPSRWKKERLEMSKAEYSAFYEDRNAQIFRRVQAAMHEKPTPRKQEVYARLAEEFGLTLNRVEHIVSMMKKTLGDGDSSARKPSSAEADYYAVLTEMERNPHMRKADCFASAAKRKGVSSHTIKVHYYKYAKRLTLRRQVEEQGQEQAQSVEVDQPTHRCRLY